MISKFYLRFLGIRTTRTLYSLSLLTSLSVSWKIYISWNKKNVLLIFSNSKKNHVLGYYITQLVGNFSEIHVKYLPNVNIEGVDFTLKRTRYTKTRTSKTLFFKSRVKLLPHFIYTIAEKNSNFVTCPGRTTIMYLTTWNQILHATILNKNPSKRNQISWTCS